MRIAHVTDIHWQNPPSMVELLTLKRALGSANLYLAGRRHHFQRSVQTALVQHLEALEPDLVVITGDLTATATESEFQTARDALDPVLQRFPTFVIPGNHDVYTPGARRARRIRRHFEPWMGLESGPVGRLDVADVTVLGLDPNRPTWIQASGEVPDVQLEALAGVLRHPDLADRHVILAIHYPLLDRRGAIYDNAKHGLLNARALIEVLRAAPKKPALILHGHEHHGFQVPLDLDGTQVTISNCGSSGYAYLPKKGRAACMNVYNFGAGGLGETERYMFDGTGFSPEPGGAYATGR